MNQIKISGATFPLHFGLNAVRIYCTSKKIEFAAFQEEMSSDSAGKKGENSFTIQQLDNIALLVQSAIKEGIRKEKTKQEVPEIEDIIEIFEDPEETQKFFDLFNASVPETEEGEKEKNPESRKEKP